MTLFCIILVVLAPIIGWRIGLLLRPQIAKTPGAYIITGLLIGVLPFAPVAFIFFDGVLRIAFLCFLGLMVLFAFLSAKRVSV